MSKDYKITFKKGNRDTGLAAVGAGTQCVDIKYRGQVIGIIRHNDSWNSNRKLGIQVSFMIKKDEKDITKEFPRKWYWGLWKASPFPDEKTAREMCQKHKDWILSIVYLEGE